MIGKGNLCYYNKIDKKTLEKLIDEAFHKDVRKRTYVIYTSALNGIHIEVMCNDDNIFEPIRALFRRYNIIYRILALYRLKEHHIDVGYETGDEVFYNKLNNWNTIKRQLIEEIKEKYYAIKK